jgi:hypothetical protein
MTSGGYDVPSVESDKYDVKYKYPLAKDTSYPPMDMNKDDKLEKLTINHLTSGKLDMSSNYDPGKITMSEPKQKDYFKTQLEETNELLALISTQLTDLQLRMTVIENKLSKIENYAITDIEI